MFSPTSSMRSASNSDRASSPPPMYTMLGYNVSVPPFVRQALSSCAFDNDDLLPTITKPVLITHGADDAIVKKEVVEQHRSGIAHAQIHIMPDGGHAPFWDDAAGFNRRLGAVCEEVVGRPESSVGGDVMRTAGDALTAL
jgi:pimeloyl-ACP methyl ester carboxylesterase